MDNAPSTAPWLPCFWPWWIYYSTQVFLLGLRCYARGQWPYYGPDIGGIRAQLPGALQALLVGLPMDVVPIPEAPVVVLNVLSLAALALFAWYVRRRLPMLPAWLVFGWLLTCPWTLNFSTHANNGGCPHRHMEVRRILRHHVFEQLVD